MADGLQGIGQGGDGEEAIFEPGINLSETEQAQLLDYLITEREALAQARSSREEKWDLYRRHRESRPEQEVVSFPWEGASNVVPPVAASNTNGVYGHIRRAFLKRQPLWSASSEFPDLFDAMDSWTRFLNMMAMSPFRANIRQNLNKSLYDAISLGDQIVEVPWQVRRIRYKKISDGSNEVVDKVTYSGPIMQPYKIENVYLRESIDNIQEQPVIPIRIEGWTVGKLRELEFEGFFENVDTVAATYKQSFEDNMEAQMQREGFDSDLTVETAMVDLWKAFVRWDIDGDDLPEDLIVWYSEEANAILRIEANEFGMRMLANMQYFTEPFMFYGKGVGAMAEHVQEEITSLHNMRINSLVIHSMQIPVVRHGVDIGKGDMLYPLRVIKTDNPVDDVKVLTFPDVSRGTLEAELQAKRYLDLHTGVSEALLGMPDQTAKSGTSPSLQMFLAQQGSAILETAIESLSIGLSEIGLFFTMQLVKNSDLVLPYLDTLVPPEDIDNVRAILEMEVEDVPQHMRMDIKTTEIQKSEDAKRQNLMALNQLYSMYAQEVIQYMQIVDSAEVSDQIKQMALRVIVGKTKTMEETLELLGESDVSDFIPYIRDAEMILSMLDDQKRSMTEQLKARQRSTQGGVDAGTGGPTETVDAGGAGGLGGPGGSQPPETVPDNAGGGVQGPSDGGG